MQPFIVIESKVLAESCIKFWDIGIVFDVDVLVLDSTPETFDEYVVHSPAPPIHTDSDIGVFEKTGELFRSELNALIRVENCGLSISQQIRIFLVLFLCYTRPGLGIDGLHAHLLHQAPGRTSGRAWSSLDILVDGDKPSCAASHKTVYIDTAHR